MSVLRAAGVGMRALPAASSMTAGRSLGVALPASVTSAGFPFVLPFRQATNSTKASAQSADGKAEASGGSMKSGAASVLSSQATDNVKHAAAAANSSMSTDELFKLLGEPRENDRLGQLVSGLSN